MDKQEILSLDNKTEEEQIEWLRENDILRKWGYGNKNIDCSPLEDFLGYESLADCAFRLRDEAFNKVGTFVGRCKIFIACKDKDCEIKDCDTWFLHKSKPIHWIMAYLLARLESEGRNE